MKRRTKRGEDERKIDLWGSMEPFSSGKKIVCFADYVNLL